MGHIPIYGNKRICTCGNESCLETVVSGVALERLQQEYFPETHISSLFKTHPEAPQIQAFITGMAQAVAAEVNLLDPDCVILGGRSDADVLLPQGNCWKKRFIITPGSLTRNVCWISAIPVRTGQWSDWSRYLRGETSGG